MIGARFVSAILPSKELRELSAFSSQESYARHAAPCARAARACAQRIYEPRGGLWDFGSFLQPPLFSPHELFEAISRHGYPYGVSRGEFVCPYRSRV